MPDGIVISGLGLTSGYGIGTKAYQHGLTANGVCLRPVTHLPTVGVEQLVAARVPWRGHPEKTLRGQLLTAALDEALDSASPTFAPRRALLVMVGQSPEVAVSRDARDRDLLELTAGWPVSFPRLAFQEAVFISQACASVLFGMAFAREWLLAGMGDAAVVAGAFTLNRYEYLGMSAVGVLSRHGARPFDVGRDGTSLGEGSAAILLQTAAAAGDGEQVLARVAGLDCRVTGTSPAASDSEAARRCMAAALGEAGLERIDYIHAHATGTPQGDQAELDALSELGGELGWRDVPVGSHKGAIGHLMHVSAGAGVAAGIAALATGHAPGTAGLNQAEPVDGAVRLLRHSRCLTDPPRAVLVNSFGFAGNTASLVLTV